MTTMQNFCNTNNISEDSIWVAHSKGTIPKIAIKPNKMVDSNLLYRLESFRLKIIRETELLYYFLNLQFNNSDISELLSKVYPDKSWYALINTDMWVIDHQKITNTKIKENRWQLFRVLRYIAMWLFRKLKRKYDIKIIEKVVENA